MVDVGPHFGPVALGIVSNLVLYGVLFAQCFIYRATHKKDKLWVKYYVAYLLFIETLSTAFLGGVLYEYLVVHFGDVTYLSNATWLFQTDPVLTGIISMSVQFFFAWRVKVLTGKLYLAIIICLFAAVGFLGGLGTTIASTRLTGFAQFQDFKPIVVVWLVGSAVPDIMVTVILVWWLRKNKTGFPVTDDLIERLMRLVVQTGLVTSVCATVDVIAFLSSSGPTHLFFGITLPKLYTNALMSSLNSRAGWGSQDFDENHSTSTSSRSGIQIQVTRKQTTFPPTLPLSSNRTAMNSDRYNGSTLNIHEMGVMDTAASRKVSQSSVDAPSVFEDKAASDAYHSQPVQFNVHAEP